MISELVPGPWSLVRITESLARLWVGIEDVQDLADDLDQALARI